MHNWEDQTMTDVKAAKKLAKAEKKREKLERAAKRPLNRFFHHIDRGSTTGREIGSGLLMCVLAVCGIFMNMQLVTQLLVSGSAAEAATADIAANGEIIAQYYFLSMIVSFIGTLAMGLIARLPLCQIPALGLSTVLISTLGIGSGMTYQNLLAVCFVSALIYTLVMAVPPVRKAIMKAIPQGVRRAAPAAVGLLLCFTMLQMTGLFQAGTTTLAVEGVNSTSINLKKWTGLLNDTTTSFSLFDFSTYNSLGYKGDSYYPWIQCAMIGAVVAVAAFFLLRKTKHPVGHSLILGTVAYFVAYLCTVVFYFSKNGSLQYEIDSLWGRLWMVGSEDAQHLHLSYILQNFSFGKVLSEGFDFTACTEAGGNVALLFISGVATFLLTGIAQTDAVVCDGQPANEETDKQLGLALVCNAGANILAPLAGISPVATSVSGVAAKRDGARSGLSAVVASLGMLVSAFVWIVPFIFATTTSYDLSFNLYGHYGVVLQLLTDCSFIVVDAVMAVVGLAMVMNAVKGGFERTDDLAVFAITAVGAVMTSNVAIGIALGTIAHVLTNLFDREERKLSVGNVAAAVVAVAVLVVLIML
jgi:adenine/guanine/hypoxanthine permease